MLQESRTCPAEGDEQCDSAFASSIKTNQVYGVIPHDDLCGCLYYGGLSDWIYPVDKYREPHGKAVKVFRWEDGLDKEHMTFTERLRLYYWLGE